MKDSSDTPATGPSSRRLFIRRVAGAVAAGGALSVPQVAPALATGWRDAWLFGRLASRRPLRVAEARSWKADEGLFVGREEPELELNATAAWIWAACDGRRTVARLAVELAREFGEPAERVRGDLARVLRELWRLGFVVLR